jgi:hypothetical protein
LSYGEEFQDTIVDVLEPVMMCDIFEDGDDLGHEGTNVLTILVVRLRYKVNIIYKSG